MSSEYKRRAIRRELEAASTQGLDVSTFMRRTLTLLGRSVRFDACCLATVDPATRMITGAVAHGLDESRAPLLFDLEYARSDFNAYRELSAANVRTATLERATLGDPARSARFTELLRPLGLEHELRVLFASEGRTWGVAALLRGARERGFDDDEVRAASDLSETIAEGLSASILVEASACAAPAGGVGPAVAIFGGDDEVEVLTPAASARLEDFPGYTAERLAPALLVAISAARSAGAAGARLRVRGCSGCWWVVSATSMDTGDGGRSKVVATIEEARSGDVVPLVVAAFGLSARERDVLIGVLEGQTSVEIADALEISSHTVNDHLKSVFAKAEVTSRRELVARIFFEHYAPRIGTRLGPRGWFAEW